MKFLKNVICFGFLVYFAGHFLGGVFSPKSSSAEPAAVEQPADAAVVETISIDAAEFSKKMDDNEVAAMAEV